MTNEPADDAGTFPTDNAIAPMRVLHVIASVDPKYGGPIEGVRQLATAGLAWQQQTDVVSFDAPGHAFLEGNVFRTIPLGPSLGTYGYNTRLVPWLLANIRNYHAVIVNGLWQFNGISTWRIATRLGVPYCVFPHGMLDPWFKQEYPLKHLKKLAYWMAVERRVLGDAAAIFFTCEEERLLAQQTFPGYRAREIVTGYGTAGPVGFMADPCRELFFSAYPALRSKRLVLFLGRVHEKKGCDLLIKAFATVAKHDPSLNLVMAGPVSGSIGAELNALAESLGIAHRVAWTGMLGREMKWGAYYAAELFALPSHQENFGISVVEALACGVPVAISDKVNIWREIAADGAGIVGHDTVDGTVTTLSQWFSRDAAQRATMRDAARRSFESRFEISGMSLRLHDTLLALARP